uniref:Uncharacterized protein n=1 Tax=Arion vulgaris TaxID=1028688 RepID=A0A0B7BES7_9EUPU
MTVSNGKGLTVQGQVQLEASSHYYKFSLWEIHCLSLDQQDIISVSDPLIVFCVMNKR